MLPTGTVTFLFTDIEGSTQLFQQNSAAMDRALARHNELLHTAIAAHGGQVFQVIGDAFCAAFAEADAAILAALEVQDVLHAESWEELGTLRVRIGLYSGAAQLRGEAYPSSLTLVRVQRVMSAGHGGQILLPEPTAKLIREGLPTGVTLRGLGEHRLRGLAEPETLYQLVASDLPVDFPPLRTAELASSDTPSLLDHLVEGLLVGREDELDQLRRHWALALEARGHLVLISGEPGIGKTRLAHAIVEEAQRTGAAVLSGGCYEYEATTPYLPFVEALRDWVQWQSAEQLRDRVGSTAPELVKLAPGIEAKIGPIPPNVPLPPKEERLRLYDNLARLLQSLAEPRGLLLFLDDLHWADDSTLALLHYVLRHLRSSRVLILGGYREVELDRTHPLASALVEWNRERLTTRISLGRLTRADTADLLRRLLGEETISEDFVGLLFDEAEGNPFFVEEIVKTLIEQGSIFRAGDRWERAELHNLAVPQSVKEAIGRRLNRLGESTIEVLHTAAALGKQFSYYELAGVAAGTEDTLLDALDEAAAAQLLRANSDNTFVFTHDKIREVLYEEVNPIRRRRLHQRIGENLIHLYGESGNGHVQDIAHHFAQSGDLERSLGFARAAADRAAQVNAIDEAQGFLVQAREAADALGLTETLVDLDERSGDLYFLQGRMLDAASSYERALSLHDTDAGILHHKVGRSYAAIGDERGPSILEKALAELDPVTNPGEYANTLASLGRYHHYRTEHTKSIRFLKQALPLAESANDLSTQAEIFAYLSGAYQHLLDYDTSNDWARRAIEFGERQNYAPAEALGHEFLAENAVSRGDWQAGMQHAARDRQIGEDIGALDRIAWSLFSRARGLYGMGELADARTVAREALELCDRIGEGRLAAWFDPMLAVIAADYGDSDAALLHADLGLSRSAELGQIVIRSWALDAAGLVHMWRRDVTRALRFYQEGLDLVASGENGVARILILGDAAEALLLNGERDRAAQTVQQALELAELGKSRNHWGIAKRVQGLIFGSEGNWEAAQRALDESVNTHEALGSRLELARSFLSRGAVRAQHGEPARAREDRDRAHKLFAEYGAVPRE